MKYRISFIEEWSFISSAISDTLRQVPPLVMNGPYSAGPFVAPVLFMTVLEAYSHQGGCRNCLHKSGAAFFIWRIFANFCENGLK